MSEAQADLRSTVRGLGRDLQGLMHQVQELAEMQSRTAANPPTSTPEYVADMQELKQQVAYLMANSMRLADGKTDKDGDQRLADLQRQQQEAAAATEQVHIELVDVQSQLAAIAGTVDGLEAAAAAAEPSVKTDAADKVLLEELHHGFVALGTRLSSATEDLSARLESAEAVAEAAAEVADDARKQVENAVTFEAVAELERQLRSVQAQLDDQAAQQSMLDANCRKFEVTASELHALQLSVEELAANTSAHMSAAGPPVLDALACDVEQLRDTIAKLAEEVGEVKASTLQQQVYARSLSDENPVVRASELAEALSGVRNGQAMMADKLEEQLNQSDMAHKASHAHLAASMIDLEAQQIAIQEELASVLSSLSNLNTFTHDLKQHSDDAVSSVRELVDATNAAMGARITELSEASEELRQVVTTAMEEMGSEVMQLQQVHVEMKPTLDMVSLLKNEVADLYVAQQVGGFDSLQSMFA